MEEGGGRQGSGWKGQGGERRDNTYTSATGGIETIFNPKINNRKSFVFVFHELNFNLGDFILETFWFFPYYMEQHIIRNLPEFKMFDYKVNYENHSSFTNTGNRKRKFGSPVRIFTNVTLSKLNLKRVTGYKYCKSCNYWVSNENRHCNECKFCTSKVSETFRTWKKKGLNV